MRVNELTFAIRAFDMTMALSMRLAHKSIFEGFLSITFYPNKSSDQFLAYSLLNKHI